MIIIIKKKKKSISKKLLFNLPSDNISITIFMVEASAANPHLFISSMSSTEVATPLHSLGAVPSSSPIFLNNISASDSEPFLHSPPIIILYVLTSGFTPLRGRRLENRSQASSRLNRVSGGGRSSSWDNTRAVLFCLGDGFEQFIEVNDGREGTRPKHGMKEMNCVIFFNTSNATCQSLFVREVSVASETREVSFAARQEVLSAVE
ncbi:BnaC08g15710D [Brassica napus]|uniref:BnaC08g15710D protein n=1 Tax=Brassica napus TaxID=3708 RepID=A0A078H0J7_BRANA|nr:BnaC08g15710D [Brassica napus]